MLLEELRDLVSWIVDFNPGQTDQEFIGPAGNRNKRVDQAISFSYKQECRLAQRNGSEEFFKRTTSFTWDTGVQFLSIPSNIKGKQIICIRDDTDSTPGPLVQIWDSAGSGSGLYMSDSNTWGWYPAPSVSKTLVAVFVAEPEALKDATDEPFLLPARHHELIAWSAAIWLGTVADQDAPKQWIMKQNELRMDLWKELQRGSPSMFPPKRIRNLEQGYSSVTGPFYPQDTVDSRRGLGP